MGAPHHAADLLADLQEGQYPVLPDVVALRAPASIQLSAQTCLHSKHVNTGFGPWQQQQGLPHLPQEAGLSTAALLNVPVQAVVRDVGAAALKVGRLHRAPAAVEIGSHVVMAPLQPATHVEPFERITSESLRSWVLQSLPGNMACDQSDRPAASSGTRGHDLPRSRRGRGWSARTAARRPAGC